MPAKQLKTLRTKVTPMTFFNLFKLQKMCNASSPGKVIDKLVREKMLSLHTEGIAQDVVCHSNMPRRHDTEY